MGVEYMRGNVVDFDVSQDGNGVHTIDAATVLQVGPNGASTESVLGENYINSAGAWSAALIEAVALKSLTPSAIFKLPVERRKRAIFSVRTDIETAKSDNEDRIIPTNSPLTIDPNGVYFRSESSSLGKYICGVSPAEENDGPSHLDTDLNCTDHELFDDIIWPTLYERVPAFDRLKVESFWSGFYDYNAFDQVSGTVVAV